MEIWKYTIDIDVEKEPDEFGDFEIKMQKDAVILHVGVQGLFQNIGGRLQPVPTGCIWALVDPEAEIEDRRFRVIGTGQEFEGTVSIHGKPYAPPVALEYVGTFFQYGHVWHLFERTGR